MIHKVDIRRLYRIHRLIVIEATGTPNDLARKLDISRSTLFEYLNYIKDELMAEIIYNSSKETYEYVEYPSNLFFSNKEKYLTEAHDFSQAKKNRNEKIQSCLCDICNISNCDIKKKYI